MYRLVIVFCNIVDIPYDLDEIEIEQLRAAPPSEVQGPRRGQGGGGAMDVLAGLGMASGASGLGTSDANGGLLLMSSAKHHQRARGAGPGGDTPHGGVRMMGAAAAGNAAGGVAAVGEGGSGGGSGAGSGGLNLSPGDSAVAEVMQRAV